MSEFDDALDASLGVAGDPWDITTVVRPCWRYSFPSGDVFMWAGQGNLFTSNGWKWWGTIDADGQDHHSTPALADGRDGSSAELEFKLPLIDQATYRAMKTAQESVAGCLIQNYLALIEPDEGLRPAIPIRFLGVYTMRSVSFSEQLVVEDDTFKKRFEVTVLAKDGNVGRSLSQNGTYSDTSQQERAAALGVSPDYGCGFVAGLSSKTLQFP